MSVFTFHLLLVITYTFSVVRTLPSPASLRFTENVTELGSKESLAEPATKISAGEPVNITIRAIINGDGLLADYPLFSREDLEKLQKDLHLFGDNIEISITLKSGPILLYLQHNPLIMAKGFHRKYFSGSGTPIYEQVGEKDAALAHCYFTGTVVGNSNSLVSISFCNGVSGVVEISEDVYHLSTILTGPRLIHMWRLESDSDVDKDGYRAKQCGTTEREDTSAWANYTSSFRHNRFKREAKLPAGQTSKTRYIEIYVVMDYSMYRMADYSIDATVMRAINIINYASALYRQLDIYLVLVAVEVWNDRDKIAYPLADGSRDHDPGKILVEFNKYRHFKINWNTANDNGQLFTARKFVGGLIGKGSTNAICMQTNSGGVTFDGIKDNYMRAATTMAHELGHNIGMIHSNSDLFSGKDCQCENPGYGEEFTDCIMHSSSSPYQQSKRWSQCNKDRLRADFEERNLDHCLKNKPEQLQRVGSTPVCGNYFVEEGEDCDCGQPADCESKCCNATTCQLHTKATCATGACCDLDTCSVRSKSHPCRAVQDSECDLDETCDGESEWCPIDTYKKDGTGCYNREAGYCYSGKCTTHNAQCHFIWGVDSAKRSNDICYTAYNNASSYYGNCGWSSVTEDYNKQTIEKKFHTCKTKQDLSCGLLHCQYDEAVVKKPKIMNFPLIAYPQKYLQHLCAVSSFDVGYQVYDPGQVPNGAKCGDNGMCVNSRCVNLTKQSEHCTCNDRGVCNQLDECHCDIGWAPPFCIEKGLGGSLTSNPPVIEGPNIQLIAGLVAFFVGVLPMVIILGVVGNCRRHRLKRIAHNISQRLGVKDLRVRTDKTPGKQGAPAQISGNVDSGPVPRAAGGYVGNAAVSWGGKRLPSRPEVQAGVNRPAVISNPVFQSTSNNSSQIDGSVKLKPSRAAPAPPNVSKTPRNASALYENVKPLPPPPKPSPGVKPLPPPKPSPGVPPKVPLKPHINR